MSSFRSRAERFSLAVPIYFVQGDDRTSGQVLNLSHSGVLARFTRSLDLWTTGVVTIELEDSRTQLKARVARVNDREAGLAFVFESSNDERSLRTLIDGAIRRSGADVLKAPF